jgi:glycine/D-amino acid oxidase-like deaminating enzyme
MVSCASAQSRPINQHGAGGQLRPHAYSRYVIWRERFGPDGAMELIRHEMAHLLAFKELAELENITEEVCLKFGETFDAAMTDEAWMRLRGALQAMEDDHGVDDEVVKVCKDAARAEEFTQMKGALAAVVHPTGQMLVPHVLQIQHNLTSLRWPYKFVHALLRILLQVDNLSLHANTPVIDVAERDAEGWMHVKTARGTLRARTVVHTTNRWAPHLLPEFEKLILPLRTSVNAIKAPPGFIKHTGSQHYDSTVNVSIMSRILPQPEADVENRITICNCLRLTIPSYLEAQGQLPLTRRMHL